MANEALISFKLLLQKMEEDLGLHELSAIENNFSNFDKLSILIDDVRCFLPSNVDYSDYPSIDYLVDWARRMNVCWRIEHDIFIMQKIKYRE